jgi:hypothetical protein
MIVGERIFVELWDTNVSASHLFTGRVAWCSSTQPWRCGISFDDAYAHSAALLFASLCSLNPRAAADGGIVERIPTNAVLSPTPVPGDLAVIVPAELEVLLAVGAGIEAHALQNRLGTRWGGCVNPLFSLLGRGLIEVTPREPHT